MHRAVVALLLMVPLLLPSPADAEEGCPKSSAWEWLQEGTTGLLVSVEIICVAPSETASNTPCHSDDFSLLPHHWTWPYEAWIDAEGSGLEAAEVVGVFRASARAWDDAVAAALFGDARQNALGVLAGTRNGVSQVGWSSLGPTIIAQTITWSLSIPNDDPVAVESDQVYNSDLRWSMMGDRDAMDLQNVATHELGHTLGLGHSAPGGQSACLTMYAFSDFGETRKRSLGDGDVLGIRAQYP